MNKISFIVENGIVCVCALCGVCGLDGWFRVATNTTQRLRQKFAKNPIFIPRPAIATEQIARRIFSVFREYYQLLRWFVFVLAWNAADGHL